MMHINAESGLGRALGKFRPLCGKRIALLEASGLDWSRLATLKEAFELAGAEVVVIGPTLQLEPASGATLRVDVSLADTAPEVYHALCIPGSREAVSALRASPEAAEFVRSFASCGKWIGTLDHGALLLEDAGVARGRTVTSDPSLRAELEQAGASWVPEAVIADHQLVTAQGLAQLEPFVRIASLCFQEKGSEPPPGYH
jgi:protease I